ncbi:hypothetical protein TUMSATVNIG1_34380 [Vibrio nigripulchritudo]|uniref:phosphopantetheine-binding protein n=1 Tax=Vibrio nigripulchritudo TaxID=28173 RepID=UPI00190ACD71|nr:phosphopantetheine-binding protein [Vibrio nigripulchritudo]BCL71472.1 hypothetical protein VNTUMSATTG_34090 [Vibrio nigripulchritudo]BDU32829.1 hypothetical protein TUMSATVNIG1_34380 [Vibrio nigripulchritudo]
MDAQQFCEELADILQLDDELSLEARLVDMEEWDSMAHLGVISMFDMEFSKTITNADLKALETVQQLYDLSQG